MAKLINKAELIERLKAGESLHRLFALRNGNDSFYVGKDRERVHAGAAKSLIDSKQVKQTRYNVGSSEYVWKAD